MPSGSSGAQFYRRGADYLVRFPRLADFLVSGDGTRVEGWPALRATESALTHLYLNQVLPLALSRQGRLVLHGSAIELGGGAVAFLGRTGRGKSTLAASFASAGARFMTDDGVRLEWREETLTLLPSHPSIRLWSDSREAIFDTDVPLAPQVPHNSKQRLLASIDLPYCDQPLPLRRLYLLGDGSATTPQVRPCTPSEAMVGLAANSFMLDIDERQLLAHHFDAIGTIAALPIHYHLDYPRRYDRLDAVRAAVLQQAGLANP